MKTLTKSSVILIIFIALTSFSFTNNKLKINYDLNPASAWLFNSGDDVIITYNSSDICGLKCLGEAKITEKWWFYNSNELKAQTITKLKKQASEQGGNIVYVNINEKKGFGIFFSTTIVGYIYKK